MTSDWPAMDDPAALAASPYTALAMYGCAGFFRALAPDVLVALSELSGVPASAAIEERPRPRSRELGYFPGTPAELIALLDPIFRDPKHQGAQCEHAGLLVGERVPREVLCSREVAFAKQEPTVLAEIARDATEPLLLARLCGTSFDAMAAAAANPSTPVCVLGLLGACDYLDIPRSTPVRSLERCRSREVFASHAAAGRTTTLPRRSDGATSATRTTRSGIARPRSCERSGSCSHRANLRRDPMDLPVERLKPPIPGLHGRAARDRSGDTTPARA